MCVQEGSRQLAAHPVGPCPGSPPGNLPQLVGTRGGMRAGRSPREAKRGERGLLVPQGSSPPAFYQSSARNTFPPGLRAVLSGSRSLVFGMRRGLHHMAGGTKTFLQGKIIMSQPPPSPNDLI